MRAAGTIVFGAFALILNVNSVAPAAAQPTPQTNTCKNSNDTKELMRCAQTEGQRRDMEDLIAKLQGRPASVPAPASPAAAPPVVAAPVPAPPAPPVAAKAPDPVPATPSPVALPPVQATAPAAAPASAPTKSEPTTPSVASAPPPIASPPVPTTTATAPPAPVAATPAPPAKSTTATAPVEKAPEIAQRENLPTADLEVYFEFASAEISPDALATLITLGRTLADPRLAGQTFLIGGYTDGKGKPEYNLALSQRRADAVRKFLVTEFQMEPSRLIAKGYGKGQYRNTTQPDAVENRRVQIINWTNKVARKP